eukprot:TRINITY_DN8423_c0_g1_i1.p1 TRINITY_DN8423_c0_g1~~TRINITY_DN8423_c0_g1_i1.p1  ORF type:complete len:603 (-),score=64.29 TRINITY_DN8423_c0_g1_i1:6-1787(-)
MRVVSTLLPCVLSLCLVALASARCHQDQGSKLHPLSDLAAPDHVDLPAFDDGYSLLVPVRYVALLRPGVTLNISNVTAQHAILNAAYNTTGVHFVINDIIFDYSEDLAKNCNVDKNNIFKDSAVPKYASSASAAGFNPAYQYTLVVVFYCELPYYGEATFPWQVTTERPFGYVQVALNALYGQAPPSAFYGGGKTLVHEMGHYLGLLHPFPAAPTCNPPGDLVSDTPDQYNSVSGCPAGHDSCPSPGVDPIHNYMGYTDDSCMWEFTPGQVRRLQAISRQYLPALYIQGLIRGNCTAGGNCTCPDPGSRCELPPLLVRTATTTPTPTRVPPAPPVVPPPPVPPTPATQPVRCADPFYCHGNGLCTGTADGSLGCTCSKSDGGAYTGHRCDWCPAFHFGTTCSATVDVSSVVFLDKPIISVLNVSINAIPHSSLALDIAPYPAPFSQPTLRGVDPGTFHPKGWEWTGVSFFMLMTNSFTGQTLPSPYIIPYPIEIVVPYDRILRARGSVGGRFIFAHVSGGQWVEKEAGCPGGGTGTVTNEVAQTVSITTCYLSQFAVFVTPESAASSAVLGTFRLMAQGFAVPIVLVVLLVVL